MNWQKSSEYSIESGKYHIAKAHVNDEVMYTLWVDRHILGTFKTAAEAKKRAEEYDSNSNTVA